MTAEALRPLALALALGCAAAHGADAPPTDEARPAEAAPAAAAAGVSDPFEGWNRAMFGFNRGVDRWVLRPAARGYRAAVPAPVRTGFSNFFDNLEQPLSSVNNLLQGKPVKAGANLARFVVNLTLGLGGFFDPATAFGLAPGDEDFGQTLGRWGVGDGPYLVLPFLPGQSLRDWGGMAADYPLDPTSTIEDDATRVGLKVLDVIETRHRLLDFDQAIDEAYDPYAFTRDAWLQRRAYQVRDGAPVEVEDDLYDDPLDETGEAPADEPPVDEPPPR